MPTSYPGGLDNFTNPTASDQLDSATVPHASQHANLNDAVEAIEGELGTNPKGAKATVKARLDDVDTAISGKVSTSVSISTTAPLTGGGDLSTNRTLTIADATTSVKGAVQLTDSVSSTSTTTAATPNAVKTAYDLALSKLSKLKQQSGTYMRSPTALDSTITVVNNRAYYTPIYIDSSTAFDRLALRTASTFSGTATIRMGIFTESNGLPANLVLDAGTVSATAASTTYEITINQTLSAGFYFLAFAQQGTAPILGTYLGATASGANIFNQYILSQTAPNTSGIFGYTQTVSGAFGNAASLTASSTVTHTWIRAA